MRQDSVEYQERQKAVKERQAKLKADREKLKREREQVKKQMQRDNSEKKTRPKAKTSKAVKRDFGMKHVDVKFDCSSGG